MKNLTSFFILLLVIISCENRDLNEGEEFRPREVHDSFQDSHFAKVTIDGVEYLMMERDNNNPHEGFGFMAYRGNNMIEKQDTALAYLRAIYELQIQTLAHTTNRPLEEVRADSDKIFSSFLREEEQDLNRLETDSLKSK